VTRPRRWAAGLLTGAFLLAVGTPAWFAQAQPSMAGYVLHIPVFVLQGLPYVVAAALWVPAWTWGSETMSVVLSSLLLGAALWLYVPVLWSPGRWGGDMIGLAFIAISGVTTATVLVASGLTALVSWMRRRRDADRVSQ
jgi:hypothetical protein